MEGKFTKDNKKEKKQSFLSLLVLALQESMLDSIERKRENKNKKKEYSKALLTQESILIWFTTLSLIGLAFFCVINQYFGELPWVAAMCGFPWAAYGVSQACYYNKSKAENTQGGIKYESMLNQLKAEAEEVTDSSQIPNEEFAPGDEKK